MSLLILLQQQVLLKQQFTGRQLASQRTFLLTSQLNDLSHQLLNICWLKHYYFKLAHYKYLRVFKLCLSV